MMSLKETDDHLTSLIHQPYDENKEVEGANIEILEEKITLKDSKWRRSHRSRQKMCRNRAHRTYSAGESHSHNSSSDNTKDKIEAVPENKVSRKKRQKEENKKRKQELDIIRSELLKKFKIAEEREIKKPHIVLPREIIPKNIKKEIEKQQKEADRRKRDFERRAREMEAKALKLAKKKKKAAKRKQIVLNENLSATATNSSSIELNTSADSNEREKIEVKGKNLLEKHLQAYHELMKEQPKRHTAQQLEEDRKRLQEAAANKQQEELIRLRKESSNQISANISEDERKALLEKLREKEKQRNIEEMDDSNFQIKRSKSTVITQNSQAKTSLISQRRAGRGRGRPQTCLKCPSTSSNKFASPVAHSLNPESKNAANGMTLDTFTWRMSLSNKGIPTPSHESFTEKDQHLSLTQIDCNLPQRSIQAKGSKMPVAVRLFQQSILPPNESQTQVSAQRPTWNKTCIPDATVFTVAGTQSWASSPMRAAAPMQHSTPFNSKPLAAATYSRPFSYSDCVKKQSNMPTEKIGPANVEGNVIPMEETFDRSEQMQNVLKEGQSWPIRRGNKEPSADSEKFSGGSSQAMGMALKSEFGKISWGKNFWTRSNKLDELMPAPTMDDWVRLRKANLNKSLDSSKSTSISGSFNTSVSDGSSDNQVSKFDKYPRAAFVKGGNRIIDDTPHSKVEKSDEKLSISNKPEGSNACRLSGETKQYKEKTLHFERGNLSRTESNGSLAQMLNQLSLTESQQSQSGTLCEGEIQSTDKRSSPVLKNENSCQSFGLGQTASNSQYCSTGPTSGSNDPNFIPNTTSDIENKALPGTIPGSSFPAGNDVQQMALSLQQQQQQLMLMFLQTHMMMMASAHSVQKVDNPVQNSNTNIVGPSSDPSSENSSGPLSKAPLLDSKVSNTVTKETVNRPSQTVWEAKTEFKKRPKRAMLNKLLIASQSTPSQRKDCEGKTSKQKLSDQEIQKVLAKLSDLSCGEKFVKMTSKAEKPECRQRVTIKRDSMAKNKDKIQTNLLVEEEENWVDGIEVKSITAPLRNTKSALRHRALDYHFHSVTAENQKGISGCKIQSPNSLNSLNSEETEFSGKKVNTILKRVPDLISRPTGLESEYISPVNIVSKEGDSAVYCWRSLRKPTTCMKWKRCGGVVKDGIEPSKAAEYIDNKDLKPEDRKARSKKKPDNPTRLMKAALGEIKNSNRKSRSRSVSPRRMCADSDSYLKKLTNACDLDIPLFNRTAKAQDPQKIQAQTQLEPYRFGRYCLSPMPSLPTSTELCKHISYSKMSEVPLVKNLCEMHTSDTKYLSVYPSGIESTIAGSKILRLPTMPLLSASKMMPKLN